MREPTLQFDDHYQKQMDELIDLMLDLCGLIKNGLDAFH